MIQPPSPSNDNDSNNDNDKDEKGLIPIGNDPAELVALNLSLLHITLVRLDGSLFSALWKAISQLPQLKTLRLLNVSIGSEAVDAEALWEACANAEKLYVLGSAFAAINGIAAHLISHRVRFLQIRAIKSEAEGSDNNLKQLELIRRCPKLEELVWHMDSEIFVEDIAQGRWPMLERLSFGYNMADEQLEPIINRIPVIVKLDMSSTGLGPLSFQSLIGRHCSMIQELSLQNCSHVTSAIIQELLCSCPSLRVLRGDEIIAKDIVNGRPWACLSIKVLHVYISFAAKEQDLQHKVFECLSRLSRLQDFSIRDPRVSSINMCQNSLDFRLKSGLGVLENLRDLRRIDWQHTLQTFEEDDIRWMLRNWKQLEYAYGCMGDIVNRHAHIIRMLQLRGVQTY
ncbi:hypothetical protein BGZ80_005863 [Entomortierella chlamydospora]|uniref:RNI-like superfamily protein n=1 Tax=Entomortierella chlamydospora TaxID=101097 RepID=A0A9P6STY5_9FUNG|nr:hypothetical protein BGZ80_005863 [Entomortierella chlamydospora]